MKTKIRLGKPVTGKVRSSVMNSVRLSISDSVSSLVEISLRGLPWKSLYNSVNISVSESVIGSVYDSINNRL